MHAVEPQFCVLKGDLATFSRGALVVANRPSAFLRASSVPFFMHFVRGFAAWVFAMTPCKDKGTAKTRGRTFCLIWEDKGTYLLSHLTRHN